MVDERDPTREHGERNDRGSRSLQGLAALITGGGA